MSKNRPKCPKVFNNIKNIKQNQQKYLKTIQKMNKKVQKNPETNENIHKSSNMTKIVAQ